MLIALHYRLATERGNGADEATRAALDALADEAAGLRCVMFGQDVAA